MNSPEQFTSSVEQEEKLSLKEKFNFLIDNLAFDVQKIEQKSEIINKDKFIATKIINGKQIKIEYVEPGEDKYGISAKLFLDGNKTAENHDFYYSEFLDQLKKVYLAAILDRDISKLGIGTKEYDQALKEFNDQVKIK